MSFHTHETCENTRLLTRWRLRQHARCSPRRRRRWRAAPRRSPDAAAAPGAATVAALRRVDQQSGGKLAVPEPPPPEREQRGGRRSRQEQRAKARRRRWSARRGRTRLTTLFRGATLNALRANAPRRLGDATHATTPLTFSTQASSPNFLKNERVFILEGM